MGYKKRSKFNAKRTSVNGINFPSRLEAQVYFMLSQLEQAGDIINLRMQVRVDPPKCPECGVAPAPSVKVDFAYLDQKTGQDVYVEAKGVEMERWKKFLKWWRKDGPAELRVYGYGRKQPILKEVVRPK